MEIEKLLKIKYEQDSLGHFYILNPSKITLSNEQFYNWTDSLISNWFQTNQLLNHEDFLLLTPSKDDRNYSLEDFKNFFSFLTYRATKEKRKIIVIRNADKLTPIIANKLLKTLEEPPISVTIFLLNEKKLALLETIKSRAISLNVPIKEKLSEKVDHIGKLQSLSQYSIIEKLKNSNKLETDIIEQILIAGQKEQISYLNMVKIENYLQHYKVDKIYNNAATQRHFLLSNIILSLKLTT